MLQLAIGPYPAFIPGVLHVRLAQIASVPFQSAGQPVRARGERQGDDELVRIDVEQARYPPGIQAMFKRVPRAAVVVEM